jgi:arsenical pump membrane protein
MPPLLEWLRLFALPSLLAVIATGASLFFLMRHDLTEQIIEPAAPAKLSRAGQLALGGIGLAVIVLLAASAGHWRLGAPTLGVAAVALCLVMAQDRRALWETPRHVSWSVLPLVAGLFVVVEGVNRAGALEASQHALAALRRLPPWQGDLAGAFGITALSNLINNLPSGLIAGTAIGQSQLSGSLRNALLIGVDLGPNLSVTGSLATILWLMALRREKQTVSAWSFLKVGAIVTPGALFLAVPASSLLK